MCFCTTNIDRIPLNSRYTIIIFPSRFGCECTRSRVNECNIDNSTSSKIWYSREDKWLSCYTRSFLFEKNFLLIGECPTSDLCAYFYGWLDAIDKWYYGTRCVCHIIYTRSGEHCIEEIMFRRNYMEICTETIRTRITQSSKSTRILSNSCFRGGRWIHSNSTQECIICWGCSSQSIKPTRIIF